MDTRKHWEELYRTVKNKDWPRASKCIDRIIEGEPENPNHYLKKGDICLKAGDEAQCFGAYLKAAWYLDRSGFLKKALAVYKMILRYDPDNDEALRAANNIMMELESPAQTPGQTEWKEVFAPAESAAERVAISPETGVAEPAVYDQTMDAPLSPGEDAPEAPVDLRKGEETAEARGGGLPEESAVEPAVTGAVESVTEPATGPEGIVPPGFLSHFTADEIDEILHRAEWKKFSDRDMVIQEGDTGDDIYLIKSGSAMVAGHFFGKEIILETLSVGDLFGEVAFLTGRTRTANVVAKGDLEVYELNRLLLEELIEKRPEILSQMNEIYVKRVRDTIRKVKAS